MRSVVIIPMQPATDGSIGLREVAEIVLPSALFFQATEEPFNQAILLWGIRGNELLG
jgi:hypothetical protein